MYTQWNLSYCTDSIAAVAHQKSESQGIDAYEMIKSAHQNALEVLKQDDIAERMAAKRCERRVRNKILSSVPDWQTIRTNNDSTIKVCVPSPFLEELMRFNSLVTEKNLDKLVARYPLRESRAFSEIYKALDLTGEISYKQTLLTRIRNDSTLAENLKQRIGPLSNILTMESTPSKGSES